MKSKLILNCNNVSKKIDKKTILDNISLKLYEGDIMGFIGPNGAGKTTIIKLILGIQKITSGHISINGYDIKKNFVKAIEKTGAIIESPDFYMYLSGKKNLQLLLNMYKNIDKNRIDEVVKLVGLENRINDKVSKYSLGMRQRLGIAAALLSKPNLLILDEPTNGLDPEGIKELRTMLLNLSQKEHIAIFISSHMLSELDTLCNKICIIKNGKLIETNEINKIKTSNESSTYIIEIDNTKILENPNNDITILSNTLFKINCSKHKIPKIIKNLIKNKIKIYSIKEEEQTLEDAFLLKMGGNTID